MLSTDDIFLLSAELSSDAGFAQVLNEHLQGVLASPAYQGWLGTLAEAEPFTLSDVTSTNVLERARLLRHGRLLVKLNQTGDGVFLTDGVWVEPRVRVFPFCDESAALIGFVRNEGLSGWADWTLDLATGCGHTALAFGGRTVAFDINPRALAYAAANRALNSDPTKDCILALNDIRDGIPHAVARGLDGNVLILANMPFGPAPSSEALPLTSNGGEAGADLQIATYRAIANCIQTANHSFTLRAFLMGLTVGDRATDRWEIVQRAIEVFGAERVRWHLLSHEHVFRIDGVRQLGNPAPVSIALPGLASCRLYTPDESERIGRITAFAELARRHKARGNPDIAYGIVEILSAS